MRAWWVSWALCIHLLALAGSGRADPVDLTSNATLNTLFPPGWDANASSCDAESNICVVRYPAGSNLIVAGVMSYPSADVAQAKLDPAASASVTPPSDNHAITGFGDKAVELASYKYNDGETFAFEEIMFSKGCYLVQVGLDAPTHMAENGDRIADPPTSDQVSRIHEIATFIDGKLDGSACPSGTIINVRNPGTGNWTPWLLVPGVGLVLLGVAGLNKPKDPSGQPGRQDQPKNTKQYDLDIRTQDNRSELNTDGEDVIWIYAQVRCNAPDVNTQALTANISFATEGPDVDWLHLGAAQMINGFKAAPVRAWPPSADSELNEGKATVVALAVIEDTPVRGPADFDLDAYELEVF